MNVPHLIEMANQIAAFFASQNEPAVAAKDAATHLRRFWEPRMRREIIAHVQGGGGEALTPIARDAVLNLAREAA